MLRRSGTSGAQQPLVYPPWQCRGGNRFFDSAGTRLLCYVNASNRGAREDDDARSAQFDLELQWLLTHLAQPQSIPTVALTSVLCGFGSAGRAFECRHDLIGAFFLYITPEVQFLASPPSWASGLV